MVDIMNVSSISHSALSYRLLIDPTHVDRFGHHGETIIPGSGERWGHLDSRVGKPMQPWEEEEVEVLPDGQEVIKNKVSIGYGE